ncbi:MAG: hypothetical protein U0228_05300 [Myxococcaceae bacterium]
MMALMLAAQLALGQSFMEEVEGITSDGKFAVGTTLTNGVYGSGDKEYWYEAIGGRRTTFSEDEKAKFDAWKQKVKLVPPVESRTSPDGKSTIDVVLSPQSSSSDDAWDNTSEVTVYCRTGKKKLELFKTSSSFDVSWTPDSRGLLVITHEPTLDHGPRGSVFAATNVQLFTWVPGAPSVNVLAPTRKLAIASVKDQFEGTDVNVTYGAAVKKRKATVVYFRKDQEAFAKKFAPKFAGATLEPLTWDSPFDVVVALGGGK